MKDKNAAPLKQITSDALMALHRAAERLLCEGACTPGTAALASLVKKAIPLGASDNVHANAALIMASASLIEAEAVHLHGARASIRKGCELAANARGCAAEFIARNAERAA